MKPILARIAVLSGLTLGAFALSAMAAGSWTAPGSTPPNGNVDAPLNTGSSAQVKTGGLTITGLTTLKNLIVNPTGGTVTSGQVLTSTGSSGQVVWTAPTASVHSYGWVKWTEIVFDDPFIRVTRIVVVSLLSIA